MVEDFFYLSNDIVTVDKNLKEYGRGGGGRRGAKESPQHVRNHKRIPKNP